MRVAANSLSDFGYCECVHSTFFAALNLHWRHAKSRFHAVAPSPVQPSAERSHGPCHAQSALPLRRDTCSHAPRLSGRKRRLWRIRPWCGARPARHRSGPGGCRQKLGHAQSGAGRDAGERCHHAIPRDAGPDQGTGCAGAGQFPAAHTHTCHRQAHYSVHHAVEFAGRPMALGSEPDRQQADQRVLHARRQDCLLHRHHRPAQAHGR